MLAGNPSFAAFKWLFAYWGFTTIALFWSDLIKATRDWGGESLQGAAFGLLDGGRGLVTAVTDSVVVAYLFTRACCPPRWKPPAWCNAPPSGRSSSS